MKKSTIISILVAIAIIVPTTTLLIQNRGFKAIPDTGEAYIDTIPDSLIPETPLLYGINPDSFLIQHGSIKRNEMLANILLKYNINYQQIDIVSKKSKDIFDLRKIRSGNDYTLFLANDTNQTANYFVYEIDNTDYLVLNFGDSISAWIGQKPVTTLTKEASGIITSSLWNTMTENKLNPILANDLSEIFAWTVDFFGIEKGDYFKITYEENYVDSVSIGIGKIHSALFKHHKDTYYAFRYAEDSVNYSFYDEEGNSLKKAFLKAPLKFSRVSSKFTNRRYHPVLKIFRPHHGIDYAAPSGTPVYAIGDGRVVAKAWDKKGGGNYIKIKHNSVYLTVYMHLNGFAKGINSGQNVKQGQLIGYVGKTGLATGPHLDFRVFMNGKPINPLKVKAPPVEPIHKENIENYKQFITQLKEKVDSIPLIQNSDN